MAAAYTQMDISRKKNKSTNERTSSPAVCLSAPHEPPQPSPAIQRPPYFLFLSYLYCWLYIYIYIFIYLFVSPSFIYFSHPSLTRRCFLYPPAEFITRENIGKERRRKWGDFSSTGSASLMEWLIYMMLLFGAGKWSTRAAFRKKRNIEKKLCWHGTC
jgi:hypothetical protein